MSQVTKHSHGPWRVESNPYDNTTYALTTEWGIWLGTLEKWADEGDQEVMDVANANARLIKAAPDLLAQCKELLQLLNRPEFSSFRYTDEAGESVSVCGDIAGLEHVINYAETGSAE